MRSDFLIIYIDESGSINNHIPNNKYFIIALVRATNKDALKRAYKRFVSANHDKLLELDKDKVHPKTGKVIKEGGKMFSNSSFKELKGSQFDKEMKQSFVDFFSRKQSFEIYYIKIANDKLTDHFCENTARVFNYTVKLTIEYLIRKGYLPNENCSLQLDERNEKTETKFFLENYLMTAQQHTNFPWLLFCINISMNSCCLYLKKTISQNKRKMDLLIRSTFIAMTDNAMEHLVVASSLLVISPSPYFCFARAKALSTATRSALSLYSVFLSVPAFFFGLPRAGPDKRIPCSLQ